MTERPENAVTVTRALSYLKSLDDKITKTIVSSTLVGVVKGDQKRLHHPNNSGSLEMFNRNAQSNFDSICKLMSNRDKIRAALTKSNAETLVTIGGKSMTVADVIEYRRSRIPLMDLLIQQLRNQILTCNNSVAHENHVMEETIERQSTTLYGKDSSKKADGADFLRTMRKELESQHMAALHDPLGIQEIIIELTKELDTFRQEVDYVLSEANATTFLDVDLT